jgi:hypothetical protein
VAAPKNTSKTKKPEQDAPQAYEDAGVEETTTNEFSAGPSSPAEERAEGVDDHNETDENND